MNRPTFTFDGCGIDGPDVYRTRLTTFTGAGQAYPRLGPLLEAAPEMLKLLRKTEDLLQSRFAIPGTQEGRLAMARMNEIRSLLNKVEGRGGKA